METNTMENASNNYIPFLPSLAFLLSLVIIDCIIFKEFCSCLSLLIQFLLRLLSQVRKVWATRFPVQNPCIHKNVDVKLSREQTTLVERPVLETKIANAADLSLKPRIHKCAEDQELTIGEVRVVMEKLGTSYDPDGDKLQERLSSNDIAVLFEEQEPSPQELKDAFGVFDQNNDGFITARELQKVLCRLCLTQATEADCKRMIRNYDNNGDGLIDFNEFARLMDNSFI